AEFAGGSAAAEAGADTAVVRFSAAVCVGAFQSFKATKVPPATTIANVSRPTTNAGPRLRGTAACISLVTTATLDLSDVVALAIIARCATGSAVLLAVSPGIGMTGPRPSASESALMVAVAVGKRWFGSGAV